MFSIIPFLVQWVALSYVGQQSHQQYYSTNQKSHWTLIEELKSIPEEELEKYLPQLCNIMIERGANDEYGLYQHFERVIMDKCAKCMPFGIRVCNLLKASSFSPYDKPGWNFLDKQNNQAREERLRSLHSTAEAVTANGYNLPQRYTYLRSSYFRDFNFMMDSFSHLGNELKAYPMAQRNFHLRSAIRDINALLCNRMISRGQGSQYSNEYNAPMMAGTAGLALAQVAQGCPDAAGYSMHFPMLHCGDHCLRILQFVEDECEALPSAAKAPYLLTVELLEQPYPCHSERLYSQGHTVGTAAIDAINRRHLPGTPPRPQQAPYPQTQTPLVASALQPSYSDDVDTSTASSSVGDGTECLLENSVISENVERFAREESPIPAEMLDEAFTKHELRDAQNSLIDRELRGGSRGMNNYGPHSAYDHSAPQYQVGHRSPDTGYAASASPDYELARRTSDSFSGPAPSAYNNGPEKTLFVRGKTWLEKLSIVRSGSAFGHLPGWTIKSFIVKAGDDLRKEMLAMQLIELIQSIFKSEGLDISLRPYQIISTGQSSGLVEFIEGASSLDSIKKSSPTPTTLKGYFQHGLGFGASYSPTFTKALHNFVRSLVGYSLVTYLLQVKDRHNANIMIEGDGSMVHIDFGFIFGDSPGFNINFESAPFKLTSEYVELMGGTDSMSFKMFEDLFVRGFLALQKHADAVAAVVELFYGSKRKGVADGVRARLGFARSHHDIMTLISESLDNWRTKQYDWFQQKSNNILM